MKGYQIAVSGIFKFFNRRDIMYSKTIYLSEPTTDQVASFITRCCVPRSENDLYFFEVIGVESRILEVDIEEVEVI